MVETELRRRQQRPDQLGTSSVPITRLRGGWRTYEGVPLMPTFHPAYLLRNPADKKLVWEDLKQVMRFFGKEPPGKS